MESPVYIISALGFVLLSLVLWLLLRKGLWFALQQTQWQQERKQKVQSRFYLFSVIWLVWCSALSLTGFVSNFSSLPPRQLLILVPPLVLLFFVLRSPTVKELLQHVPQRWLIAIQAFRIPVEVLLWSLFTINIIPVQMTFEGRNLDIVSGIAGLVLGLWLVKPGSSKALLWVYNLVGLALLINIVSIAVLSMPLPFRVFMNEPANTIVMVFPFILLPGFLVPLAYFMHALSIRKTLYP